MWEAVLERHGEPPFDTRTMPGPLVITSDGTSTPVKKDSENERQALCHGSKGSSLNNYLAFAVNGTICDYAVGIFGVTHDSRAAQYLFQRHADISINPTRVGMVVDVGLKGFCHAGENGNAAVLRPLSTENVPKSAYAYCTATSAWLTSLRQFNENGNGGIKRSFPGFCRLIEMNEAAAHAKDLITMINLFNPVAPPPRRCR